MAFNPFATFRKNSKPILAVVTIFIMFIFVLSAGVGQGLDFFDWVARQLGGSDQRGPVLGTIDGEDYHAKTLQELRVKRAAANNFMFAATAVADEQIVAQVDQDIKSNSIKNKEVVIALNQVRQMRSELFGRQSVRPQFLEQLFQMYQQSSAALSHMANTINAKENPKEFQALRSFARVVQNDLRRVSQGNRANSLYFDTVPNTTDQNALQFSMYLHEADKLGIKFVDDDVKRLIADETERQLSEKDASQIDQRIRRDYRALSSDQIFRAIGDEFRVAMVMKILVGGYYSGRSSFPTAMTPHEFFEFYKDRCSPVTFDVVNIPVDSFLPQVKEEPTSKELLALFDSYRKFPYDPARETPGFEQPRKVMLEYVAVDSKLPIYTKTQPFLQAASMIGGGFTSTYVGAGPLPALLEAAAPLLAEPLLVKEELRRKKIVRDSLPVFDTSWHGVTQFSPKLRDSSYYSPLPAASLVGRLAVATNPVTGISSAAGFLNLAYLIDTRERVRLGLQMTLAPFNPLFPINPWEVAGPLAANLPPEPSGVFALEAANEIKAKLPETLARMDLETFQNRLRDIRKKLREQEEKKELAGKKETPKLDPQKIAEANSEARKIADSWILSHPNAPTGKSSLDDKYHLGEDPVLKDAFADLKNDPDFQRIVDQLFFSEPNKEPPAATLYSPFVLADRPDYSKPVYLAWKIEDQEAKIYNRYDEAPPAIREEVLKAWKMQKARVLAQQAADKLAGQLRDLAQKELRDANNREAFFKGLTDLAAGHKYELLTDPIKIAMLTKKSSFQMGSREQVSAYEGPEITNKQIVYPPTLQRRGDMMARQLLEVRDKPLGEVLVEPNVPRSHFYVAVMTGKQEKQIEDFYNFVFRFTNVPPEHRRDQDTLYRYAFDDLRIQFSKDFNERMKAETNYKETEEMKKIDRQQIPE